MATLAADVASGEQRFRQALACQERAGTQQPTVPFMRLYFAQALKDQRAFRQAWPGRLAGSPRRRLRQRQQVGQQPIHAPGTP